MKLLAQVGAVALLSHGRIIKVKLLILVVLIKLRFRKKVVPGDVLRLEVEIIKMKGPVGIGKAVATVDGEKGGGS